MLLMMLIILEDEVLSADRRAVKLMCFRAAEFAVLNNVRRNRICNKRSKVY